MHRILTWEKISTGLHKKPEEPCTKATKAFYGEVKYYDYDKPGFSLKTGHFTQVN